MGVRRYRKPLFAVLLSICFIVLLLVFVFGPWFQASRIILGEYEFNYLDKQEFADETLVLSEYRLLGISSRNIFFLNTAGLKNKLLGRFSEIENLTIKKRPLNKLLISIKERGAFAVYCGQNEICYFVDRNGIVWSQAPQMEGSSFILIKGPVSVSSGVSAISPEYLLNLKKISEETALKNIFIKEYEMQETHDVKAITSLGFYILFDLKQDIAGQIQALFLTLDQEIGKERINSLEYIDLRIPNRVYYKMSNQ